MTNTKNAPDGSNHVMMPTPGRLSETEPQPVATTPATPAPTMPFSAAQIMQGFHLEGRDFPVMVSKAAGLLNLAHSLRHREEAPDMDALRQDTITAIRAYEQDLGIAGILPEQARAAHYVVCATLDDVIRNMPWGQGWSQRGLVSTFHHDVTGGDKVFDLLHHFQTRPGANRDLLLLIYLCLSLGFEGRTRISARGALELAQIRDNLYRILRQQYGDQERDLSPHWKGQNMRHQPLRRGALFMLFAGLSVLTLAGLYLLLGLFLNRMSENIISQMAALPPGQVPSLYTPEPVVETPPSPPPEITLPVSIEEPETPPIEGFISFLQPEVEEGLVRLFREDRAVLVRVANNGAFRPGSAQIALEFTDIFERIGQALAAEDFDVTILGHTDNSPIRTAPFPSNFHLSTARASAVRDILVNYIADDRVEIRGEADLHPIADNETIEGREANRRTEILVREAGARISPQLLQQGNATAAGDAQENAE